MTIFVWVIVAWLVATAAVGTLIVFAILFFSYRARVPGFAAQARSARYVVAYEDALQWLGVGYRERERLTGELRSNIADAAADSPVREILERMGPAKELARGIASRRRGPTWLAGAWAALVVATGQIVAVMLMNIAFLETVTSLAAPGTAVAVDVPFGITFEGTMGADGFVQSIAVTTSWWLIVIPLFAFSLWSRPWRLITRKAARRAAKNEVTS